MLSYIRVYLHNTTTQQRAQTYRDKLKKKTPAMEDKRPEEEVYYTTQLSEA